MFARSAVSPPTEPACDGHCPSEGTICSAGLEAYDRALRSRLRPDEAVPPCLTNLHLLVESPAQSGRLTPVPPMIALSGQLEPVAQEIDRQRSALSRLTDSLLTAQGIFHQALASEVDVRQLDGTVAISAALEQAVSACTVQLRTAQRGGHRDPDVLREAADRNLALLARGVGQRTVYLHSARNDADVVDYVSLITKHGAEVRTTDEIIDRLIICDEETAFIPADPEQSQESALEIRNPGIVRYLIRVFEHAWGRAIHFDPSHRRSQEALDENTVKILRLMVEGGTDASIARAMGLSDRTIHGRIRQLCIRYEAASRTQLAFKVARLGLIDH